jgi:ATP synthase protein I
LATSLTQEGRQLARKVLFYQSIIAILLTFIFTLFSVKNSGISALYGGLICLLPGMVFALLAFRYAGASQNKLVVRSFNKGSKLKFIFTIVLFVVVYKWPNLQPIPLIVSYVVTLMAQWPIIIFISRVDRR